MDPAQPTSTAIAPGLPSDPATAARRTPLAEQISAPARLPAVPYRGARTVPAFTGAPTGAAAELHALLANTGMFDLGWRSFLLCKGEDRVRWLNGMVTNSVTGLARNAGCYAFVLNAQGRIQGDATIYLRGDALWLQTDAAQVETLTQFLDRYIIMDDVELRCDSEWTAIGIAGPGAAGTLATVGLSVEGLAPIQLREDSWEGVPVCAVAARGPLVPRYELWVPAARAIDLWQALSRAGARPCGSDAVEQLRILEGVPAYSVDITNRELPQETAQMHALHFSKGCYLGQEIVERIRSRGNVHRAFSGFLLQPGEGAPDPAPKSALLADGQPAGELTSIARIQIPETGERLVALGYIRREALDRGSKLTCGEAAATAMPLPFHCRRDAPNL